MQNFINMQKTILEIKMPDRAFSILKRTIVVPLGGALIRL